MTEVDIWVDEEDDGLWPRRKDTYRTLHGVAFPDPDEPECHIVRFVGVDAADADDFAAQRGGLRVDSEETTTIERTPWRPPT